MRTRSNGLTPMTDKSMCLRASAILSLRYFKLRKILDRWISASSDNGISCNDCMCRRLSNPSNTGKANACNAVMPAAQ